MLGKEPKVKPGLSLQRHCLVILGSSAHIVELLIPIMSSWRLFYITRSLESASPGSVHDVGHHLTSCVVVTIVLCTNLTNSFLPGTGVIYHLFSNGNKE
jgi:hypothetical protein